MASLPPRRDARQRPFPREALNRRPLVSAIAVAALFMLVAPVRAQPPTPEAHFGFRMGTDRRLAPADAIETYFELVAARTDRVKIVELGASTEGRRTIAAFISAPRTSNLERSRANRRL
jgi:hypothetical protein